MPPEHQPHLPPLDPLWDNHSDYSPQEPPSVTARRYRSSTYFLEDQLKRSEALNDFRQTKTLVNNLPQFSLRSQLAFALQYTGHEDV
ncbi:MAG: hypothetical protein QE263_00110 [Vampirovibrionales bacterium]|nr:hypothetical protein [Vampirovibrionales bacterium]